MNGDFSFFNQNHQVELKALPTIKIYEELKESPNILKPKKSFLSKSSFHPGIFKPLSPLKIENENND